MSSSTNAILFYGFCWDQEGQPWDMDYTSPEEAEEEWEDRYARATGLVAPEAPPPDRRRGQLSPAKQAVFDAHVAYQSAKYELERVAEVIVAYHCSAEARMPYVAVAASRIVARRGWRNSVTSLHVDPTWDGKLGAFCTLMGIKPPIGQVPLWWLVSYWSP